MTERPVLSLVEQLRVCIGFFTRVPVRLRADLPADAVARSAWAYPVAGAAIGAVAALCAGVARHFGLSPALTAIAALGVTIVVTGALHEDGLADTADGLGGGRDAAAKLAIMRDSRIGSYGVLALLMSFACRAACLTQLAGRGDAAIAAALVAAHAGGRAVLPALMTALPLARTNGAAASVGRPSPGGAVSAMLLGAPAVLAMLGAGRGAVAILLGALVTAALGRLAFRGIGGYTGDILGAAEQAVEMIVLVVAASG